MLIGKLAPELDLEVCEGTYTKQHRHERGVRTGWNRLRRWGQAPAAFCGCPIATLIPATFMGRVVTPGEDTTAAGTDTTGGFAKAT